MNARQQLAINHHCRFAFETAHPCFAYLTDKGRVSVVLTVNSGYE